MSKCNRCGSMAINPLNHGREQNIDMDLCDVCYWRKRAEEYKSELNVIKTCYLNVKGINK